MRSDVKIGIAVGVVVIVIGLIWFVLLPNKSSEEEAPATTEESLPGYGMESPEEATAETAAEQPDEPPQDEGATELTDPDESAGEVSVIVDVQPSPLDDAQSGAIDAYGSEGVSELAEAAPAGELPRHAPEAGPPLTSSPLAGTDRTGRWGRRLPSDAAGEQPSDLATMPVSTGGGQIGEAVGPAGDGMPSTGAATTYTVVAGDSFWRIAEQVYGDGSKYPLIRDANPSVDPNVLRPGMRLVIPPLPAPQPPSTSGPESATGEQLPAGAPAGSRTYVVQQNDSYWKIALAEYGNGLYHYVLQEANSIEAGSLRPGMVLIIPPKPAPAADTGATNTETAESADQITPGPGQTIYTVVAGDSFWRIAKSEYGAGHLWPAIREANPQVDARRLQAGQKLIIPSIEDARRAVGEEPSGDTGDEGTETTRPASDNRPVFD